ncbi:hypothetical protein K1T71_004016 [Dendrolimus kikuchii]|uniref:Uncharacterized protein n=1 Tax=Dendrolimus kikuchii TaxID=765133 RepID=A0ACC1DAK1_9NEOP|nr:hypothetical protein K1T71_004016 [Dendrolimus kikuchii]
MLRITSLFATALVLFIGECSCQHIIYPTYRPPPQRPFVIRTARDTGRGEPQWLFQGDNIPKAPTAGEHPVLPSIIDDVKLNTDRRYARSLSTPSVSRGARGGHTPTGSRDTGPTHPGYNRRNARDLGAFQWPSLPTSPTLPPLYVNHLDREARSVENLVSQEHFSSQEHLASLEQLHRGVRSVEALASQENLASQEHLASQEQFI